MVLRCGFIGFIYVSVIAGVGWDAFAECIRDSFLSCELIVQLSVCLFYCVFRRLVPNVYICFCFFCFLVGRFLLLFWSFSLVHFSAYYVVRKMLDLFLLFAYWYKQTGLWSFPLKITVAISHVFRRMGFLFLVYSFLVSLFRFSLPLWSQSCRFYWFVCFPLFHFQVVGAFVVIHFWVVFIVIREFCLHYFNFWEFGEVSFVGRYKVWVQGHLKLRYVLWMGRGNLAPTLRNYSLTNSVIYVFHIFSHFLDIWSLMNQKKTNLLLVFFFQIFFAFSIISALRMLPLCYLVFKSHYRYSFILNRTLHIFVFAFVWCFYPKFHHVWWFLSVCHLFCSTGLSSSFIFNTF